ncbi:hypothetical protein ACQUQU_10690 [Thalassolituus sp. LLYu03]|uniref:hypothetical protein n=1 Tax=Thalassolituus sp. LLYu03 TaxID=3421656 RepID=UPI003D265DA7
MQKRPTKRDIRNQLDQEVQDFLQSGGRVSEVARGVSGLMHGRYVDSTLTFDKPKEERTPLTDVLKTIDQRREAKKQPAKPVQRTRRPQKKVIYDDFGEPLRIVWED